MAATATLLDSLDQRTATGELEQLLGTVAIKATNYRWAADGIAGTVAPPRFRTLTSGNRSAHRRTGLSVEPGPDPVGRQQGVLAASAPDIEDKPFQAARLSAGRLPVSEGSSPPS